MHNEISRFSIVVMCMYNIEYAKDSVFIIPVLSTILVYTSHTSARHSEDRCSYCGLPVVCMR